MTKRINRNNQLLKEELGKILLKERNFQRNCLVTITRVETTTDLRRAKIWISIFPENQTSKIIQILNREIYSFQQKINKILKMRPVPKIRFFIERKTKQAARVEELLGKIKKSS